MICNLDKNLIFKKAKLADLSDLLIMENLCFLTDKISRRQFGYHINHPQNQLVIARHENIAIGYFLLFFRKKSGSLARLYSLAILPKYQGLGWGRVFMQEIIKKTELAGASALSLEVSLKNKKAQSLYENFGFEKIGQIKNYYENGDDALRQVKRFY